VLRREAYPAPLLLLLLLLLFLLLLGVAASRVF
jgi:hypothetical protein